MSLSVRVAMVSALAVVATALPGGGFAVAALPGADVGPTTAMTLADEAALPPTTVVAEKLKERVSTWAWSPPSPDPSDITYIPGEGLLVSDAEVEETVLGQPGPHHFADANLWWTDRTGAVIRTGSTLAYSNEPAGITYYQGKTPAEDKLLVADDVTRGFYVVTRGPDGSFGTPDDGFTFRKLTVSGMVPDPESIAVDTSATKDHFYVADGANSELYRYSESGVPQGQWDLGSIGAIQPEGLTYDPLRDTLLLLDDGPPCRVYEITKNAQLLNVIDITAATWCNHAAGITLAPTSNSDGRRAMYVVDRGKDNDNDPFENDGAMDEMYANLSPIVSAGPDAVITDLGPLLLTGSARDETPGNKLNFTWSKIGGPGNVAFSSSRSPTTNATFSTSGTYVLQLAVSDGSLTTTDRVTVVSSTPPVAAVNATPTSGTAPLKVTIDASGSSDSDGIDQYTFDFKDGSAPVVQNDPKIDHVYTTGGVFDAHVMVTDKLGVKSSASARIVVNAVPTVSAGPDRSVVMPAAASLAGSASDDGRPNPPGTLTTSWSKVSGPGTATFAAVGAPSTTATFSAAGTYVLRLTATDSATTATDDMTVTVQAAAPAPPPPPPPVAEPAVPTTTVHAVSPQRILDTRRGIGAKARKLRPGRALTLQVEGRGGFPSAGVDAAMLNITVLRPKAGGSLTVWPSKLTRPGTKSMGFKRGVTKTKLVKTTVGSDGKIRIYNRSSRPIHLLASTSAWWGPAPAGWSGGAGELTRMKSYVRLDTRSSGSALGPRSMRAVKVTAKGALAAIPSDIDAVLLKVVAREPSRSGYLTVFPGDRGRQPWVMSVSFPAGTKAANKVLVPVDSRGRVSLYNRTGRTHVTVRVLGWVSG